MRSFLHVAISVMNLRILNTIKSESGKMNSSERYIAFDLAKPDDILSSQCCDKPQ
jgi:hypothetical protein